ncbi:MAG: 4-hydroxy-tetrahydrodipicolinate reductase [Clostridia bacterium]|nr:4-hydroxy-tetrahydrodipicolinate reductase [Clostridia bacterium]
MKIIINGACGRMGQKVYQAAVESGAEVVACVDVCGNVCGYKAPFFGSLYEVGTEADALIDFSNHASTADICAFAQRTGTPCVIASTGHTESELAMIRSLSSKVPVFVSGNMSLGISVLISLCKNAVAAFGGKCDIEIIEKHHRNKLDAPSGTALMIANELLPLLPEGGEIVTDRSNRRAVRPENEIGVSSIRCGAIFGEHEVIISRKGEMLSVKHTAEDRALFAEGAINAADFISGRAPGYYTMKDLIAEKANA